MLLADVAAASAALAATRSRLAKRDLLAGVLRRASPTELPVVVRYLSGELRQRRTGLGWRSLAALPPPAVEPSLTVSDADAAFAAMAELAGPGSAGARGTLAAELFAAATEPEQRLLRGLVTGDLRQGALDALVLDAVAQAAGVPAEAVRRAVMLAGSSEPVAVAALGAQDAADAAARLAGFGLTVGRPVRPMLAASAPDVASAVAGFAGRPVVIDAKLDGIRIQVHLRRGADGDEVRVFTRSLDDITDRVPEVVAVVRALPVTSSVVLDGEALAVGPDGRPRPFQETASRSATRDAELAAATTLTPFFFDVLHVDGADLLEHPLADRLAVLDRVAARHLVDRSIPADVDRAQAAFEEWVAGGLEGVLVKDATAPYEAGRRGAAWVKVKPRHTLDLVVLAV
ncbi:MAG TPA: ATP-dependent DNA ligase, partial [Actinotalea sp.]|nr:ATP-dependent DNA ligase [Actinotalea sp.]